MKGEITLISQSDIDVANRVISELNENGTCVINFKELTPVAIFLIHNSIRIMNSGMFHRLLTDVTINGETFNLTPLFLEAVRLYPEISHGGYYIQIHGWHDVGEHRSVSMRCQDCVFALHSTDDKFRDDKFGRYMFLPPTRNDFVDFNYNTLDKDESTMKFIYQPEYKAVTIELHLTYVTENIPNYTTC